MHYNGMLRLPQIAKQSDQPKRLSRKGVDKGGRIGSDSERGASSSGASNHSPSVDHAALNQIRPERVNACCWLDRAAQDLPQGVTVKALLSETGDLSCL